jgi:PAS domain S-box-containing protein
MNKKPHRMLGNVPDAPDRKQTAVEFDTTETELLALINSSVDQMCCRDKEGAIIAWNHAFASAIKASFGVEPYIGMKTVEYLAPEQRKNFDRHRHAFSRAVAGETIDEEFSYTLPNGEQEFFEIAWSPIRKDDEITSIAEVIRNISKQKRIEEELRIKQKDLEVLTGRLIANQEEELRRLARDLHDDLTQQLALLAIEAGKVENNTELPTDLVQSIESIKNQLIELSNNVHSLSRNLHPSIIEDLGLESAVKSECSSFSSRTGLAVEFSAKSIPVVVVKDIALTIYRVVQEALSNIVKHANTNQASVYLEGTDSRITLSVCDKGVGFDTAQVRLTASLGLASMTERLRSVNGTLTITSKPQQGTCIEAAIPLNGDVA